MITPDPSPTFPACPTFGFSVKPQLLVKKTKLESGRTLRDRKWQEGLRVYEGVPLGQRPQADIEAALQFYWAVAGEALTFRFKDWSDYKSCALDDEVAPTDQPFTVLSGSPSGYRLAKKYEVIGRDGSTLYTEYRRITRPRGDTIRVANEVGVEQASSRWTIDEATGILTPAGTFAGVPTTWGGEFDVPVAFDQAGTSFELTSYQVQTATITLEEDRDTNAD